MNLFMQRKSCNLISIHLFFISLYRSFPFGSLMKYLENPDIKTRDDQGRTGHCGNNVAIAARLFFLKIRGFFLRMCYILKIFSENLRLFLINVRVFQRFRGFLNTYLVELMLF
jgi:hypothetical protein